MSSIVDNNRTKMKLQSQKQTEMLGVNEPQVFMVHTLEQARIQTLRV